MYFNAFLDYTTSDGQSSIPHFIKHEIHAYLYYKMVKQKTLNLMEYYQFKY